MIALAIALLAAQPAAESDFHSETLENEELSFSMVWPRRIAEEPLLQALLVERAQKARRESIGYAREARGAGQTSAMAHYYEEEWRIDGSTPVLWSLGASTATFAGGAHGNMSFSAILWDRARHAQVQTREVLGAGLAGMSARYCAELDRQRAEKRDEPVRPDPDDPFTICPPLAEQVMRPADTDGNGRFDVLTLTIAPYIAGPYAEGDYQVDLPFEPQDLAALPEAYRPSFEVGGERRAALPAE